MSSETYIPAKVWKFDKENGGKFSSINRPTAGATHQKHLPKGKHPIQLYSQGTPNGIKVTILLEELLAAGIGGAEYDAWLIDISKGEQFGSGFVDLNPNSKIPAMIDHGAEQPVKVFETGAILLYLAEKFGHFIPSTAPERMECLSWLFWQVGSTPYLGGGFYHFYKYAPVKSEYAIDRFTMETKRQLDVLDRRLADRTYILGDGYTIADIAIFPWYGNVLLGKLQDVFEFLGAHEYRHARRWAEMMSSRPALQRGLRVNRGQADIAGAITERHDASDFEK
jgi:GSH-dependent disulfide-bond oxidoreductase